MILVLVFTGVYTAKHDIDYLNALWFTFATFTTIGFGGSLILIKLKIEKQLIQSNLDLSVRE